MRNLAYLKTNDKVGVDLVSQAENVFTMLQHRMKYGVEVVREYVDVPPFHGHPTLIGQLVLNLVVNALDAMEDQGRLTIRIHPEENHVVLEIQDTGPGIPEEIRSRVFEPFFTTKDVGRGTGLGLYTVYQIVERHGGIVSIDSEPGHGTTVRVSLITATEDEEAACAR
jgi:signal transduction histidine kinase